MGYDCFFFFIWYNLFLKGKCFIFLYFNILNIIIYNIIIIMFIIELIISFSNFNILFFEGKVSMIVWIIIFIIIIFKISLMINKDIWLKW